MKFDINLIAYLSDNSNEGVWLLDEDFNTLYTNSRLKKLLASRTAEIESVLVDCFRKETEDISVKQFSIDIEELNFDSRIFDQSNSKVWIVKVVPSDGHGSCSEDYASLFEYTPVPIWDEDLSMIKNELDKLSNKGISDFRTYFIENPVEVERVARFLIVNDVNQAVVDLNEAESKAYLLENFWRLIDKRSAEYAINQFVAIANGDEVCEFDAELKTFKGNIRYVRFKWRVVKGYEDYSKVFLITTDLTERIVEENVSLQNSVREKEVLLKEVHHRVKNNLQIISSLLNLQSRNINEPHVQETFEITLNRIQSMAIVHELLYKSKDISHINISEYVNRLVHLLLEALGGEKHVSVKLNVENVILNINTAIPLGLMINEIMTNALIHGIPKNDNAEIYLQLKPVGDHFSLEIGDNGKGICDADFDSDSLGLQLIEGLIEQLNGNYQLDRNRVGTHYSIVFNEIKSNR